MMLVYNIIMIYKQLVW